MSKKIKRELENEKAILTCAEQFGLVGDPTRMKICWLLCKHRELSVGEIADILDVSVSVVSHALKSLKQREVVRSRKEQKRVFYAFSNSSFSKVLKGSLRGI